MLIPFIISTLAGLSTLLGVIPIFIKISNKYINKFITFSLSFSISIMISISIFDLIPTSFIQILSNNTFIITCIILCISFIISIILITLLTRLINKKIEGKDLYKLGILNMIVLMLHNMPEGIATFLSSTTDITLGIRLATAITLHNIPEGLAISVPIYYATGKRGSAIKATLLSGLSEPFGALLAYIFLGKLVTEEMISIILILVAGLMITLSIQELLPKAKKYQEDKYIYFGFLVGIILVIISLIL